MNTTNPSVTQWVCQDCLILLANGDMPDEAQSDGTTPCSKLDGLDVTLGMTQEGHTCGRATDEYFGECDCEEIDFSTSQCDGCGSWLGGSRHAATIWFDED